MIRNYLDENSAVAPARAAEAVTVGTPFAGGACRAIYVGGAGDMAVTMSDGKTMTFQSVSAGQVYPIRATEVNTTGTTATSMVALY